MWSGTYPLRYGSAAAGRSHDDFPERVPVRVPQRLQVCRVGDVEPTQHKPRLATRLTSALAASIGCWGSSPGRRSARMDGAELGEPLVVDAHDFDCRFGIPLRRPVAPRTPYRTSACTPSRSWSFTRRPGSVRRRIAALAVLVEAGLSHAVGARILPGVYWRPAEPNAVHVT